MPHKIISSSNQGLNYIGTFLSGAVSDGSFQSIQSIFADPNNPNNWTATEIENAINLISSTSTFLDGTSNAGFIPDAKNFLVGTVYNALITRYEQLTGGIVSKYDELLNYSQYARVMDSLGMIYQSLVNNNKGNALTDNTKWAINTSVSIGDYKHSAQILNHNGWLICNGQAVSRTTYAGLFTIIGTAFGVGDGLTTFNLPDNRGRVAGAIGQGSGLTNRILGNAIGEEQHTQTINEMPSHSHSINRVAASSGGGAGIVADSALGGEMANLSTIAGRQLISNVGSGQPFNVIQPTLFIGNLFIYSGV